MAGISRGQPSATWKRGDRKPQTKTLEKLLHLYANRITYWNNLDKIFEENTNAGNFNSQTTLGAGSPGLNDVRTAPKAQG